MNIYIPDPLKQRMDSVEGVNWSAAAVAAFEAKLDEVERARRHKAADAARQRQEILEDLIMDIEGTAEWRGRKAEEYPDDGRNAKCAEALGAAIPVVSALPSTHPLLVTIQNLYATTDDLMAWTEAKNEVLSRFGFDGPEKPESLLESLQHEAEALLREAGERD